MTKIVIAVIGVALGAVLVVSATMGAESLVPGGDSSKRKPPVGLPSSGSPRLLPTGFAPMAFKGTGFKPGENVTVSVTGGAKNLKRQARANDSGSFVVRLTSRVDRCNGISATAVGDKGSRTSFQLSELLCAASGTRS